MLLTLTLTRPPATDLGFLLHKHPERVQEFSLPFGSVHVFYPEATEERCTAALLLDVDPVGLVRRGVRFARLDQYVNDRPYVASSFLSVALSRVFNTALAGTCNARPELPDEVLSLEARLSVLPVAGGEDELRRLFEPLGYQLDTVQHPLDERFPEWGSSRYHSVHLRGNVRLRDLLTHLYVLIPVLDAQKHYWVGDDEVQKLLARGEGWLSSHPDRELIVNRYLKYQRPLARAALEQLLVDEDPRVDEDTDQREAEEAAIEQPLRLNDQRHRAVVDALRASGAVRVVDLGCGNGKMLRSLMEEPSFETIVGVDISYAALEMAQRRLQLERLAPQQRARFVAVGLEDAELGAPTQMAVFDAT
jgi:3' terminal RNA ribose 2'-O-methyltransferase Hen1